MSETHEITTRTAIIEAAGHVLRQRGISGISTREVATAAEVPLSQIHYHFGSKRGLIIAIFEHSNAQLLDRQERMYADPSLSAADQWDMACSFLDEDIASGYVRTLMELWAWGWSDTEVAKVVRDAIQGWEDLIAGAARRAEKELGTLGPFTPQSLAALVGSAFIGAEAFLLLDFDPERVPVRKGLADVGALIRQLEPTGR